MIVAARGHIQFNQPHVTGRESEYIGQAIASGRFAGDGPFTKRCTAWLEERTGSRKALLTHSCTAALEMSALLADIQPGDEAIMPSFTFVSTANAFVLRGGVPVFVDIRPDTLNMDETKVEAAITPRTKAVVAVHYAGVGCEMDTIMDIARRHGLRVVEDAAQGVLASYRGRPLGSMGDLGCFSFHETKNVICGEGGALLVNNSQLADRAEIIREKGTNRSRFLKGQVDKYTWVDMGSSYLPGEVTAAFLLAQLDAADDITRRRLDLWSRYHDLLKPLEAKGLARLPSVPAHCQHNAHSFHVILANPGARAKAMRDMEARGISTTFHYVPLHSSPAGIRYGRAHEGLAITEDMADRLLRLPLHCGLDADAQDRVVAGLLDALGAATP